MAFSIEPSLVQAYGLLLKFIDVACGIKHIVHSIPVNVRKPPRHCVIC